MAAALEPMEITIGTVNLEVTPIDGELEDGLLKVQTMKWTLPDGAEHVEPGSVVWEEEQVKEAIGSSWMETGSNFPDTSDDLWTETRIINKDTIKWEVLEAVYDNQPTTNRELVKELDRDEVSAYTSKLKDDLVVASIGKDNGGNSSRMEHVLVVTHVGMKELACEYGVRLEGKSGMNALFSSDE